MVALTALSPDLTKHARPGTGEIVRYAALLIGTGSVHLLWLACMGTKPTSRSMLIWIGLMGLLMRAAVWPSQPILEDDHYRYLWDGAVTASGHNPYAVAPIDVATSELAPLAAEAGQTLERINNPTLRTIYPPVAQAVFAIAHWVGPFNMHALRAVLLGFDILTAVLILLTLRAMGRPAHWVAIWWASPLVVTQITNALHMDVVVSAFLALAAWCAVRNRTAIAAIGLMLSAGAKLVPAVLLPIFLRGGTKRKAAVGLGVSVVLAGLFAWPIFSAGLGDGSGFTAYAENWDNNEGLFRLQASFWHWVHLTFYIQSPHSGISARLATAVIIAAIAVVLTWRKPRDAGELIHRALLLLAAVFMLSPTQFPWYYVWIVPLLALAPRWSLLAYPVLLSGYYLQERWPGVVWLEHGPVYLLLIIEAVRGRGRWSK